jgi:hypothetical protein
MKNHALSLLVLLLVITGCHTSASFLLPPDTELIINNEKVVFKSKDDEGRPKYERTPFFWTSIVGIEYMLIQNDKVIKKDRLPSSFRIASIFWPPYAYIYWPFGFSFDCYDLSDQQRLLRKVPSG